jgi:hypothetical protein
MPYTMLLAQIGDIVETAVPETVEPQTRTVIYIPLLIMYLVSVGIIVLIIIGLIRLVRFLGSAGKEQKLIRMEVSKLAEEVHLLRQELKGGKNSNSSAESG